MHYYAIPRILMPAAFILILIQPSFAFTDHSVAEVVNQCRRCHPRAFPSHVMSSRPVNMPDGAQSGPGGKMLCITCHDCTSGICSLRTTTTELCSSCHDCTQGMSCVLGMAHLGNKIKRGFRQNDCLSCHDGSTARNVAQGMKSAGHKVDVFYVQKRGYKKRLDRRVVLVDGKVTCISCHNPYKSERRRLVMSNERSELCMSCHMK